MWPCSATFFFSNMRTLPRAHWGNYLRVKEVYSLVSLHQPKSTTFTFVGNWTMTFDPYLLDMTWLLVLSLRKVLISSGDLRGLVLRSMIVTDCDWRQDSQETTVLLLMEFLLEIMSEKPQNHLIDVMRVLAWIYDYASNKLCVLSVATKGSFSPTSFSVFSSGLYLVWMPPTLRKLQLRLFHLTPMVSQCNIFWPFIFDQVCSL